jgi:hypothetical protein
MDEMLLHHPLNQTYLPFIFVESMADEIYPSLGRLSY